MDQVRLPPHPAVPTSRTAIATGDTTGYLTEEILYLVFAVHLDCRISQGGCPDRPWFGRRYPDLGYPRHARDRATGEARLAERDHQAHRRRLSRLDRCRMIAGARRSAPVVSSMPNAEQGGWVALRRGCLSSITNSNAAVFSTAPVQAAYRRAKARIDIRVGAVLIALGSASPSRCNSARTARRKSQVATHCRGRSAAVATQSRGGHPLSARCL